MPSKLSTEANEEQPAEVLAPTRSFHFSLGSLLTKYGAVIVLLIMIVGFSIAIPATYPTDANLKAILGSQAAVLMVSVGLVMPAVVGEFDLSVGSMVAFSGITTALLLGTGIPLVLAILIVLVGAGLIGMISGLLIAGLGMNSLIATLGIGTVLTGLGLWLSDGRAVLEGITPSHTDLGQSSLLGIPLPAIYAAAVALAVWYLLSQTPVGRRLYAVGGNRLAAELAGVRVKRSVVGAFIGSGFIAALAGIVIMLRSGAGDPNVGPDLLLPAFAAVFLGATTISPGKFNVLGTVIGVLLVAAGVSGLQHAGADAWVVPLFNGCVLLIAVGASRIMARREG